jgi:hypothetical protein
MLPQRYASMPLPAARAPARSSGSRALTFDFAQKTSTDQLDKADGDVNPLPCLGLIQVMRGGEK